LFLAPALAGMSGLGSRQDGYFPDSSLCARHKRKSPRLGGK
jgi:hypothetical protein